MEKKWLILLLMGVLAVGLLAMAGCDDDDDDVVAPTIKPQVMGMIFGDGGPRKAEGDPAYAYVSVNQVSSIPTCEINGVELGLEPEMTIYGSGAGFYGYFELGVDNAVTLSVEAGDDKSASATITMPGSFAVVGNSDVQLMPFTSHTFEWTASDNADIYWIRADFEINYNDTEGNPHYWEREYSVFTTDTEITFTAEQMFPEAALVDVVTNIWGDLDVMSVAGPIQPGDTANMTGDCTGFVTAIGDEVDWDIEGMSPIKSDREQELDLVNDFAKAMR